ncbi:MAG: hypothetical protein QM740_00670 [Acidovorax sp.]
MATLDTLYGYHALPADGLQNETSSGTVVKATAKLDSHADSRRVWAIPVALQRDAEGKIPPAPEWIPTSDWEVKKKSFVAKRDQHGGCTADVAFDFGVTGTAEGAAVVFIVQAPTLFYMEYMKVFASAVQVLRDVGEPETATAVSNIATDITAKLNLSPPETFAHVASGQLLFGSKEIEGSASPTELEALRKALEQSLYGAVIKRSQP